MWFHYKTLATAIAEINSGDAPVGQVITVRSYSTPGDGGGFDGIVEAEDNALYPGGKRIKPKSKPITPRMFGAKGNGITDDAAALNSAAEYCRATGERMMVPAGHYMATTTINFRHVQLTAPDVIITAEHDGIGVILGGNSSNPNNPVQVLGRVARGDNHTTTPLKEVRIIGAKGQYITLNHCDRCEFYADSEDPLGGSIGYSSFWLKNVWRIYINNNPTTSGSLIQWVNENHFYLNRTREVYFEGTYDHNHNIFQGGTFEGNGIIRLTRGRVNIFRNIRAEGFMQEIFFGTSTEANMIFGSWWGSNIRLNGPELAGNVIDEGAFNIVMTEQAVATPLRALCVFTNESLIESTSTPGNFNIAQVRNIILEKNNFTVSAFQEFYVSGRMPVVPKGDVFVISMHGVSSGGFRTIVNGYDNTGNDISSTGIDIFLDSSGPAGFNASVPPINTNTDRNFWITNPNTAFITISVIAGGNGLVAKEFIFGVHSTDQLRTMRISAAACTPNI